MSAGLVVQVVAVAVLLTGVATAVSYNRFVRQRNLIRNAWANVDTELRRRYDLIPNLVETVKGYASHERGVLEAVVRARAEAAANHEGPDAQARDENVLVEGLRRLMAVAEDYPELKASEHFRALQDELANTEDRIQAARRFFNNNVRDFNRRVQAVPSMLVARLFGFREETYFEIAEAVRRTVPRADLR